PLPLPPPRPPPRYTHSPSTTLFRSLLLTAEQEHLPPRQDLTSLPSAMPMAAWLSLLSPPPSRRPSLPLPLPPPSPATEELHSSPSPPHTSELLTPKQLLLPPLQDHT